MQRWIVVLAWMSMVSGCAHQMGRSQNSEPGAVVNSDQTSSKDATGDESNNAEGGGENTATSPSGDEASEPAQAEGGSKGIKSFRVSDPEPPDVKDPEMETIPEDAMPRVQQWVQYFQGRGRVHMETLFGSFHSLHESDEKNLTRERPA
jgi:hypothetical protein